MEYGIRKIDETELTRLVEMCNSHSQYEKATYEPVGKQHALQSLLFDCDPKLFCYVIEADCQLVGYFSYTFDISTWSAGKYLHLDCLYLEPTYRGLKIGDKVFDTLIAIANENKCVDIQWHTPAFNEKAIKFYKRMGATWKDKVRFFLNL